MNILTKLTHATRWSLAGLWFVYKNELAFKIELVVAIVLIPLAVYISEDMSQLLWLMFTVWLVLLMELLNSGIEAIVDRIGLESNELSKRAKDIGSAAVFVSIIFAAVVWALFILHYCGVHIKKV